MNPKGFHYVIDAYDCHAELINDAGELKRVMMQALEEIKIELLMGYFHSFWPQGVTGFFALSSSHFSIHTWPEHGYAAFDLYSCTTEDLQLQPVIQKLLISIGAKRAKIYKMTRGVEVGGSSSGSPHQRTNQNPYKWDIKVLNEIKSGNNHTLLYEGTSPFHKIFLAEAKDLRLYLDEELQFSSLDEKHYHEPLVLPAMEMTHDRTRILILGGGDGLALREVLKYKDVEQVDLVDIDQQVVQLAKNNPTFSDLNRKSLSDPRVSVHIMDARNYVKTACPGYGVIIMDFPDPFNGETNLLYTREFFKEVKDLLAEDGMMVTQAASLQETPNVFGSIGKTLTAAGLKSRGYYSVVPSYQSAWGFYLASRELPLKNITEISVPTQAIESPIDHMFTLPSYYQKAPQKHIINTNQSPNLFKLYQQELNKTI